MPDHPLAELLARPSRAERSATRHDIARPPRGILAVLWKSVRQRLRVQESRSAPAETTQIAWNLVRAAAAVRNLLRVELAQGDVLAAGDGRDGG